MDLLHIVIRTSQRLPRNKPPRHRLPAFQNSLCETVLIVEHYLLHLAMLLKFLAKISVRPVSFARSNVSI